MSQHLPALYRNPLSKQQTKNDEFDAHNPTKVLKQIKCATAIQILCDHIMISDKANSIRLNQMNPTLELCTSCMQVCLGKWSIILWVCVYSSDKENLCKLRAHMQIAGAQSLSKQQNWLASWGFFDYSIKIFCNRKNYAAILPLFERHRSLNLK